MDIVQFWEKQVDKWNQDKKCGFCWAFSAPMQESQSNIQQQREGSKCCVQVFLTNISFHDDKTYNNTTGFVTSEYCEWNFNLFILLPSDISRNNYNEITGYPIEQSKWNSIFQPIYDCIGCKSIIDFCEIIGYPMRITKWGGKTIHNYLDNNFDGWKINATFRNYNI